MIGCLRIVDWTGRRLPDQMAAHRLAMWNLQRMSLSREHGRLIITKELVVFVEGEV